MDRTTIDFGIDLGTTNSAVAWSHQAVTELVPNFEASEITPSAVCIDASGSLIVGQEAKRRLEFDWESAVSEFKSHMGTDWVARLRGAHRTLTPEDLSAEVLKSLRADVVRRIGEDLRAAVITVPAAFEAHQCDATRRAARLAGFELAPLLQEPVAAAVAFGFRQESADARWLVFDFGGGTFDAAIVELREGRIRVVGHRGDNQLGGKLLDWEIVNQLFVPEVQADHALVDFRRGNPRWRAAFAKLKHHAELAKIRLTRAEATEVIIDRLCLDDRGEPVPLTCRVTRSRVNDLLYPYLVRAMHLCRDLLAETNLKAVHLQRVVLTGGPTVMPGLREFLSDPVTGLGIPLDDGVDPMTVVARGAALFAEGQIMVGLAPRQPAPGSFQIELDYRKDSPDTERLVTGRLLAPADGDCSGLVLEIRNATARMPWRSGRIPIRPDGRFDALVWCEEGSRNRFEIDLYDAVGTKRPTTPASFELAVGVGITRTLPLLNSIGVALADNRVDRIFGKGSPLPLRERRVYSSAFDISQGQGGHLVNIPVVEGESPRADRNSVVGFLVVPADRIQRDIPAGQEIQVTIAIDETRTLRTKAYIPLLDEWFEATVRLGRRQADPQELAGATRRELARLGRVRREIEKAGDSAAGAALARIDAEQLPRLLNEACEAATSDASAAVTCESLLRRLRLAIDTVEDLDEWPALVAQAQTELQRMRDRLGRFGAQDDADLGARLEGEVRSALGTRSADLLRQGIEAVVRQTMRLLKRQPEFWTEVLVDLERKRHVLNDARLADQLFSAANAAAQSGNAVALRAAVTQLVALLPIDAQAQESSPLESILSLPT